MRSYASFYDEVKNRYDFTNKRSMKTLIQQVKEGWNGHTWNDEDIGVRVHKPVTGEMCSKFFDHCIKELESWIKSTIESGTFDETYQPDHFTSLKSK